MNRIAISACVMLVMVGTTVQAQKRSPKATQAAKKSVSGTPAWKTAYSDAGLTVSVDSKRTIRQSDGSYSAHLRWKYAADQAIGRGKAYRTMVETRLIDCDSMRTKPVSATTYTVDGKTVSAYDTKPTDIQYLAWATRKPGSTNENALEGVCKVVTAKK